MSKIRLRWLLPVFSTAFGCLMIVTSHLQKSELFREYQKQFKNHAQLSARLIQKQALDGAKTLESIYTQHETSLETAVTLVATYPKEQQAEQLTAEEIRVWASVPPDELSLQEWGPLTPEQQHTLVQQIQKIQEGLLWEQGPAQQHQLYCARYLFEGGDQIACKDAQLLLAQRRLVGFANMLGAAAQQDILYMVVQEEAGVIASSPKAGDISSWEQDPLLTQVLKGPAGHLSFRRIDHAGRQVFEALMPFALPDQTTAIFRVGIDAAPLLAVLEQSAERHNRLMAVVLLLVLLSFAVTAILSRQERQQQLAAKQLASKEEESRHWLAIGQMAATVAHEVRNPLNTIKMAAQRLQREFAINPQEQEEYRELTELMKGETDRVNQIVTEFLALGRPLDLVKETISIEAALNEALVTTRYRAQSENKNLQLTLGEEASIRIDRQRFRQIVDNLVGNALDAVAEDGKVQLFYFFDTAGFHLRIEDNGVGMDSQTQEQALQPFVTSKARGTGLGLPLAKRLVEAHGGQLSVVSTSGRGTCVELTLPR